MGRGHRKVPVRAASQTEDLIGSGGDGSDMRSPAVWLPNGPWVWKSQLILSPFGVEGKNHCAMFQRGTRICCEPKVMFLLG